MSDSVRPQRRPPTRLPCPRDSPGKNTGVGCHFLLQCMKLKSESEVAQSCPTLLDPMDCSLPGSSVHGISQASVLEWGAIALAHTHKTPKQKPTLCRKKMGRDRLIPIDSTHFLSVRKRFTKVVTFERNMWFLQVYPVPLHKSASRLFSPDHLSLPLSSWLWHLGRKAGWSPSWVWSTSSACWQTGRKTGSPKPARDFPNKK